jgi:hypothetical protein
MTLSNTQIRTGNVSASVGDQTGLTSEWPATTPTYTKRTRRPIDPAKSYLGTLPRELKLEVIDHIYGNSTGFVKDPTEAAFSKRLNLVNLPLLVHVHRSGMS